jgi:hypothetical protein
MLNIHLNISNLGTEELNLARSLASFIGKIKTLLGEPLVQEIASMFPSGTVIDTACITLCNEALAAIAAINGANIQTSANQIQGIWTKLHVDLVQLNHGSTDPRHNFGYYLKCVGVILEDLANSI